MDDNQTTLANLAETTDNHTTLTTSLETTENLSTLTNIFETANNQTTTETDMTAAMTSVVEWSTTALDNVFTSISSSSPSYDDNYEGSFLDHLEAQNRSVMAPAIFFAGLVAPCALLGNLMVIIVYRVRFKESATRSFILTVASFDLLSTLIALPLEIYAMFHAFTFPSSILCKTYIFIEQFSATASAATLVVFAVHRYRKICTPLKNQMTVRIARSLRFCVFIFALGVTWPAFILYGYRAVQTPHDGVMGHCCGIQDYFRGGVFSIVYRCVFLALFFIGAVPITVMYIFVARKVLLLRRCKCTTALPYQRVMREMMFTVKLRSLSESSNSSWKSTRISAASLRHSKTQSKMFSTPKRTTLMIAVTTFIIFISFLPNLILRVVEHFCENFVSSMNDVTLSVYHILLRFYYLHCAANPIIYSAFSTKFRQQFRVLVCGSGKRSRKRLRKQSR